MKNSGTKDSFENLTDTAKEYLDMRIDALKLQLVHHLSILFAKIVYIIIILICGGIAAAFFAAALSSYIGELLNSEAAGTLITGGIFVLIIFILYLKRKTIFTTSMVKMFSKMFFEPK